MLQVSLCLNVHLLAVAASLYSIMLWRYFQSNTATNVRVIIYFRGNVMVSLMLFLIWFCMKTPFQRRTLKIL